MKGALTVAELIKLLEEFPPTAVVLMQSDAEGNRIHALQSVTFDGPTERTRVKNAPICILVPGHADIDY